MTKLYYCSPCNKPICPECFFTEEGDHYGHKNITKLSEECAKANELIKERISAIDKIKKQHECARFNGKNFRSIEFTETVKSLNDQLIAKSQKRIDEANQIKQKLTEQQRSASKSSLVRGQDKIYSEVEKYIEEEFSEKLKKLAQR